MRAVRQRSSAAWTGLSWDKGGLHAWAAGQREGVYGLAAMPTIDWTTAIVEPAHHGVGDQLCVDVRGADASWAQHFNDMADGQHRRGEVRGGRWGLVRYNEVEGHITVDDLHGGVDGPIRHHLIEMVAAAFGT